MPSMPYKTTVTGLSSTFGFPLYVPDYLVRPFGLTISTVIVSSGTQTYNVEVSNDYTGSSSFISSAATWFSSLLSGATSNAAIAVTTPVTAIRPNVTAGASQGTVTVTIV